jgi:anti-anti-sigma factor
MPIPLITDTVIRDGWATLTVTGEIDPSSAPTFIEAFDAIPAHTRTILDLTGITFMDSSGLHAMLRIQSDATGHGRMLVVVPSSIVARLFEISGADRMITTRATVLDALTVAHAG